MKEMMMLVGGMINMDVLIIVCVGVGFCWLINLFGYWHENKKEKGEIVGKRGMIED
jgi:hypothetical protein